MTTRKAGAADKSRVTVDMQDLTCEEIEFVEDYLDTSIVNLLGPGTRQGKAMRALGYVVARRANPELTIEEAGGLRVFFKMPDPLESGDKPSENA